MKTVLTFNHKIDDVSMSKTDHKFLQNCVLLMGEIRKVRRKLHQIVSLSYILLQNYLLSCPLQWEGGGKWGGRLRDRADFRGTPTYLQ